MVEQQVKTTSPEEEIRELERKLEEKKQELLRTSGEAALPHTEKQLLKEVLREHIEEEKKGAGPAEGFSGNAPAVTHVPTDDPKKQADDVRKKENREEQMRHLVEIAMTKSIRDAVKIAQASTPYLLDELHDHLVDDYYDKLIALKKIKKL